MPLPESLLAHFWPENEDRTVWGVFDGARSREIYSHLLSSYLESVCLYAGDIPHELERNAPHLVRLDPGDRSASDLIRKAWGNRWGIFAEFRGHIADIRTHLRHLLLVQDHNGKRLLFRYYDPRILRAYLPTCNRDELAQVFGPLHAFWVESPDPSVLLQYRLRNGLLDVEKVALG